MDNLDTSGFGNPAAGNPTGSDAAAILLMMLGDSEAAEILSYLEPDEVQHLGSAMFNVADVSEDQVVAATVTHHVHAVATDRKRALLTHLLTGTGEQALVFCKTKHGSDQDVGI